MPISLQSSAYQQLKSIVNQHRDQAKRAFENKHRQAAEFFDQTIPLEQLREHSTKLIASAAFTSNLILPSANHLLPFPRPVPAPTPKTTDFGAALVLTGENENRLVRELEKILTKDGSGLSIGDENAIAKLIEKTYAIRATAELEGKRLNTSFGRTGYEQHLPRYPGDDISQHDEWKEEGMTPGVGAWGYFADSKATMTNDDYLKEKYYMVAQTWLSANWTQDPLAMYNWFKQRKMIMINPGNGRAVVGVLGDSGPAEWTGKVFGASPETMYHLRANTGMRNEKVLLFFVDDGENKVPLGPVGIESDSKLAGK